MVIRFNLRGISLERYVRSVALELVRSWFSHRPTPARAGKSTANSISLTRKRLSYHSRPRMTAIRLGNLGGDWQLRVERPSSTEAGAVVTRTSPSSG